MLSTLRTIVCFAAAAPLLAVAPVTAQSREKPESVAERISYSVGMNVGQNLARDGVDLDVEHFLQGVRDALEGNEPLLSEQEIQAAGQQLQQQVAERRQAAGAEQRTKGEQFLAENAERPEVKTTDSGLQYEVLRAGEGESPAATDTVTVHYRGTLLDGTEFDSSYARGEPATFPLNRVIPGWTEGLQLMNEGAKYKLYIPSDLAYGKDGTPGGPIPPNATLVFEVELVEIGS
jgi:FKBP-type peptidyl-prolyl cis-trans isomerase